MVQGFERERERGGWRGDYKYVLVSWGERVGNPQRAVTIPTGIWQFSTSEK
jgi:hypothetical protein